MTKRKRIQIYVIVNQLAVIYTFGQRTAYTNAPATLLCRASTIWNENYRLSSAT